MAITFVKIYDEKSQRKVNIELKSSFNEISQTEENPTLLLFLGVQTQRHVGILENVI